MESIRRLFDGVRAVVNGVMTLVIFSGYMYVVGVEPEQILSAFLIGAIILYSLYAIRELIRG